MANGVVCFQVRLFKAELFDCRLWERVLGGMALLIPWDVDERRNQLLALDGHRGLLRHFLHLDYRAAELFEHNWVRLTHRRLRHIPGHPLNDGRNAGEMRQLVEGRTALRDVLVANLDGRRAADFIWWRQVVVHRRPDCERLRLWLGVE